MRPANVDVVALRGSDVEIMQSSLLAAIIPSVAAHCMQIGLWVVTLFPLLSLQSPRYCRSPLRELLQRSAKGYCATTSAWCQRVLCDCCSVVLNDTVRLL